MESRVESVTEWIHRPLPAEVNALFRIAVGVTSILTYLLFLPYLELFFADTGIVPEQQVAMWLEFDWSVFHFNNSLAAVWVAYALLLFCLTSFTLGVWTRTCAAIGYVLSLSFHHRFPFLGEGTLGLINFYLFASIFAPLSDTWYLSPSTLKWNSKPTQRSSVFLRLIQVRVFLAMLSMVLAKFTDSNWLQGTIMKGVWVHPSTTINLSFLAANDTIVAAATYGSFFVEIFFCVGLFFSETRRAALFLGIGLLLMIGLTLTTVYFSEVMLAGVLLLLTRDDLALLKRSFRQSSDFLRMKSHARPVAK